jgi:ABC-type antimicrobial peptide transport system permease subunit
LPAPHLYVSLAQNGSQRISLAIRIGADDGGGAAVRSARATVSRLDSSIPLDGVRTLASVVGNSLATKRLTEILLAAFAAVAVLLAAVGIYGVMSLSVANRRREFGVRLAVGAEPRALIRLVLREGAMVTAIGVGIGVIGAVVATRWMASLLYGVSPTEPIVFVSLSALLGAIAVASCFIPALRASRSDPLIALRAD